MMFFPIKKEKNVNNSHRIYKWSTSLNALKLLEAEKGVNISKWEQIDDSGLWYIPFGGGSIELIYFNDLMEYVKKHGVEIKSKGFLKETEKEYLKNVVKPWENQVQSILKCDDNYGNEFLRIILRDNSKMDFPKFKKGTRYCGLKVNLEYNLVNLELVNSK